MFSGAGCGSQDSGRVLIPKKASRPHAKTPQRGEILRDIHTRLRVAKIIGTRKGKLPNGVRAVFWRARGVNDVCANPNRYPNGWQTRNVRLKAEFRDDVQVRLVDGARRSMRKPSTIYFGASQRIVSIHSWSGWDSEVARAAGTRPINACVPYCAAGTITPYPVTVTVSQPRDCGGSYRYLRVSWTYRSGPRSGQTESTGFGYLC